MASSRLFAPTQAITYVKREPPYNLPTELTVNVYSNTDLEQIYRLSRPNLKAAGLKLYITNLKLFKKIYDTNQGYDHPGEVEEIATRAKGVTEMPSYIYNFKFLLPTFTFDPIEVLKASGRPLSTQKNYINAILPLIQAAQLQPGLAQPHFGKGINFDDVYKYYQKENNRDIIGTIAWDINKNEQDNIISKKKEEKYKVSFQQVIDLIPKLKEDGDLQGALILSFMTQYKIRNEIGTLTVLGLPTYVEMTEEEKLKGNYIVVENTGYREEDPDEDIPATDYIETYNMFMSRGDYKTNGKWGVITTPIEGQLKIDLEDYLHDLLSTGEERLFVIGQGKTKGTIFTKAYISKKVGRITKKYLGVELGTSSITKLFITTLDKHTINALIKLSKTRGTSIEVLISSYFNNV